MFQVASLIVADSAVALASIVTHSAAATIAFKWGPFGISCTSVPKGHST
jgi:hypothetical protein